MLSVHLKKRNSTDFAYLDSEPDSLARFLKERDARAWDFVSGPAVSRAQFLSAQGRTTSKAPGPAKPRVPARASAVRHPLPKNLRGAIEAGYDNARIAAMVKVGAFVLPKNADLAIAEGLSERWLFEARRRGLIFW